MCVGTLTDVYPMNEYADVGRILRARPKLVCYIVTAFGEGGGANLEPLLHNALQLQHHASKASKAKGPHALQLFKLHASSCQHVPDLGFLQQLQHALHNSCAQSTCLRAVIRQMHDATWLFDVHSDSHPAVKTDGTLKPW